MPLSSVEAVQLTRIEVVDRAAAVTPEGTVGAVVSAGGGGGLCVVALTAADTADTLGTGAASTAATV
jgi:galactokinase